MWALTICGPGKCKTFPNLDLVEILLYINLSIFFPCYIWTWDRGAGIKAWEPVLLPGVWRVAQCWPTLRLYSSTLQTTKHWTTLYSLTLLTNKQNTTLNIIQHQSSPITTLHTHNTAQHQTIKKNLTSQDCPPTNTTLHITLHWSTHNTTLHIHNTAQHKTPYYI